MSTATSEIQHYKELICMLLDGELDRHKQNEIEALINSSTYFQEYYQTQKKYKETITEKVQRKNLSPEFKSAIIDKIRGL